jgi:hypothetical protein
MQTLELGGVQVRGAGQATLRSSFVASLLSVDIILELIHQELESRDVRISNAVSEIARDSVLNQVGGEQVLASFDPAYQERLTRRTAEVIALQLDLAGVSFAEEDLRAIYEEEADAFQETCVSHILLSARDAEGNIDPGSVEAQAAQLEEEARVLRASIVAGANFTEVARRESDDAGSAAQGGELGCAPPGQYVAEFEDAVAGLEVGDLSEPVRTQFGFHLITVTDRKPAPFEQVAPQLRQQLLQQSQPDLQRFIQERLDDAEIAVNPRYGRFEREAGQVVPPDAPAGRGQRVSRAPVGPTVGPPVGPTPIP